MPYGCISYFPPYLTHKSEVDKDTTYSMKPLLDRGLIIESFRNLIKELYFKKILSTCDSKGVQCDEKKECNSF